MNKVIEQMSATGKGNVEAALKLAKLSAEAANQLMHLQMEAAKSLMSGQAAATHDAQSNSSMPAALAEKAAEGARDYSRKVYDIAAQTQHEIAAVMEERFNVMRQDMQVAMEELLKHAPGGAEPAVNAMKAAFASSQNAFEAMSKAAKQGVDAAEVNLKAAMTSATAATKKK